MGAASLSAHLLHVLGVIIIVFGHSISTSAVKVHIVTIVEEADVDLIPIIDQVLSELSSTDVNADDGLSIEHHSIIFQEGGEFPAYLQVCEFMSTGVSVMLDLTWEGWIHGQNMADNMKLPYIHLDITTQQFVHATDDFLRYRNATDAALVFPTEYDLDQALLYLVGNTFIRIIVLNGLTSNATDNLRQLKPVPSQFVMFGTTEQLNLLIDKVNKSKLLERDSRWTIVLMDFGEITEKLMNVDAFISVVKPSVSMCCSVQGIASNRREQKTNETDECNCGTSRVKELFVKTAFQSVGNVFQKMLKEHKGIILITANCSNVSEPISTMSEVGGPIATFFRSLTDVLATMPYINYNNSMMKWNLEMDVHLLNSSGDFLIGDWTAEAGFENRAGVVDELIKRFFRIGTNFDVPFVIVKRDASGEIMRDSHQEIMLEGFCIDLLEKLAAEMKFDYRIIIPEDQQFGSKDENGTWNGLIADLVKGDTDMIIAPLTITSEREEAIDFVAPYFEQSGISIVMRKAEKTTSLFKFMSVLKEEVWWCILAALIVTALVLWVVDRYSPYSGRNKELYPYKCREFTLTECFWFALTSMTPQGGGEPPKAVSGRILVAAYWIFVVLMLATFTANLAAFLTVERMQSPVNSMEELAKQSKINYSVVNGTSVHEYFKNMALAEEELYRVWKDMTLNSSNDQSKFRVWDYPIKEQYSRILNVITGTGLLQTPDDGFRKVNEDLEKKFAFIHDASIIRYEVYHNCNLTEVGEPFAEQPYAIAVQSGSHLQDEIGKHLLELQKDRYFETLSQKYWNSSFRKDCPNNDDSEGITLASIGGVFIATLVGLVIGMITLAGEIFFYRKKNKSKVMAIKIKPTVAMRENK